MAKLRDLKVGTLVQYIGKQRLSPEDGYLWIVHHVGAGYAFLCLKSVASGKVVYTDHLQVRVAERERS